MSEETVLVTGATGYVGGRLISKLLQSGYRVRTMGRSIAKLQARPWAQSSRIELVKGDVLDPGSLKKAVGGCRAAFYLVHSMNPQQRDFAEADRQAAKNMAWAAEETGLERIVYLGGLGDVKGDSLSKHLRSRHEVAEILQSGTVPTTFLRAAMILGSGGASFEILRYLVDRLPVMLTPRWVDTPCQPISISNVLNYLQGCLEHDEVLGQTFDIGGHDVLSYRRLMEIYAEEAGLPKRRIIPVPVLTPHLSAYWIHLITPVPASLAMPLTEGLRNPVICKDNKIRSIIPQDLLSCRETIRLALQRIEQERVDTCWSDAGALETPEWTYTGDATYAGGTLLGCHYRIGLKAKPEEVWSPISQIGGENGWYFGNALWSLRGFTDRLFGGIGLRRGRRHPSQLQVGDALDFWRVLEVEPPHRLLLVAEMKLPGDATLEFRIVKSNNGETELQQLSRFLPKGLMGIIYWYVFLPFHHWIYRGMLRSIARSIGRSITSGPEHFTQEPVGECQSPDEKTSD
ncbi:MAG: SDR family oxidoreductase [Thermodesulfobacteriota bacterium]|nr:SDR family oxidoreductase [Thermodesulfobacteriota bacterium]